MWKQLRSMWVGSVLVTLLALPGMGLIDTKQIDAEQIETGQADAGQAAAEQTGSAQTARLVMVARRTRRSKAKKAAKAAPAVSRAQMELAQQMVRNAYALGHGLPPKQRVALMTRLLYTMRPEVMAAEKKQWAEELFGLAEQLPRTEAVEVDSARNAAIATAAARVAVYDADRALELLDTLPPPQGGQADARAMAARLVFAGYMQHHGALGAQVLLAHGRRWSEHGGFPYGASAAALARLRPDEAAADDFFRQVLVIFERGQEGVYGVSDFASLLEQAVAMEAISEEAAEEAGRSVVGQLGKLVGSRDVDSRDGDSRDVESRDVESRDGESHGAENHGAGNHGAGNHNHESHDIALTPEQEGLVVEALGNVRISAPKAYEDGRKTAPSLFAVRPVRVTARVELPKVDLGLQSAFRELADAMRARRTPDTMHEVIARGMQLVNTKYMAGACAPCASPDAQSWALVSLAALATPLTIATQLTAIEDPFWHGYFLVIAAQQVGQPTRVADPTARKVAGKEEAEPE